MRRQLKELAEKGERLERDQAATAQQEADDASDALASVALASYRNGGGAETEDAPAASRIYAPAGLLAEKFTADRAVIEADILVMLNDLATKRVLER